MAKHILIIPGDGIGPEVCAEAEKILNWLNQHAGTDFTTDHALAGGNAYDVTGKPLPDVTLEKAHAADAILLGAVGGPKWEKLEYDLRPERALLGLRKELGLFANLRPAKVFDALVDASSLKREVIEGLDIMIVRELTGDLYFGTPRGIKQLEGDNRRGVNTMTYTTEEIHRVAAVALELAKQRSGRLCSVDKANVLETMELWREEVIRYANFRAPNIVVSHMYVDNAAMQLVRTPKQFDVIVTGNMFGDILSDIAAMLTGSLGMLPSASLGAKDKNGKQPAMYEPVHGSAPDIAGKGIANPIATIMSLSMMLRYSFHMNREADAIDNAIDAVLKSGLRTGDIMQPGMKQVGTTEMGEAILKEISKSYKKQAA